MLVEERFVQRVLSCMVGLEIVGLNYRCCTVQSLVSYQYLCTFEVPRGKYKTHFGILRNATEDITSEVGHRTNTSPFASFKTQSLGRPPSCERVSWLTKAEHRFSQPFKSTEKNFSRFCSSLRKTIPLPGWTIWNLLSKYEEDMHLSSMFDSSETLCADGFCFWSGVVESPSRSRCLFKSRLSRYEPQFLHLIVSFFLFEEFILFWTKMRAFSAYYFSKFLFQI